LVKITGNSQTYRNMADDIDFDAGRLLSGERTMDELAEELLELVVGVAGGVLTKPERLGHREYFITYKHQDTPALEVGCRA
jgi:altronate hydrolase